MSWSGPVATLIPPAIRLSFLAFAAVKLAQIAIFVTNPAKPAGATFRINDAWKCARSFYPS